MTLAEVLAALGGSVAAFGAIMAGVLAYFSRAERRLWKRVEKLEDAKDDCHEELAALKLVTFRNIGVGDDTGKFLIDEAREEVRSSKRPSPPPPVKS